MLRWFILVCLAAASRGSHFHPPFRLQYQPKRTPAPVQRTLVAISTSGMGRLYSLDNNNYYSDPVQLLELKGTPFSIGEAYGELLADQIVETYEGFFAGHPADKGFTSTLDWLWDCSLKPNAPAKLLAEIDATEQGGMNANVTGIKKMLTRVLTGSNLPADAYNIQILVKHEMERHGNGSSCHATGKALLPDWSARAQQEQQRQVSHRKHHPAGHCDFFAAWGSRTEDGRLISSRNLDIAPASGISRHKLITVYQFSDGRIPYATVGFSGYVGALAGMSQNITVSEANLDNGAVSFDGIAWPLRLRQLMGHAQNLSQARVLWSLHNNTAAFNFLIGSAADPPGAVALETTALVTAAFTGGSRIEQSASYTCNTSRIMDGSHCVWPNNGGRPVLIGEPLDECVFRSNHALHPDVRETQEPLWNDTVMRYFLLHDRLEEVTVTGGGMSVDDAINVTSLLGIKGADYGSCAPANFLTADPTHVMSVVYDPSRNNLYAAWEDGLKTKGDDHDWSPAGCNTYLWVNLGEYW
jgi:hypothetical protein